MKHHRCKCCNRAKKSLLLPLVQHGLVIEWPSTGIRPAQDSGSLDATKPLNQQLSLHDCVESYVAGRWMLGVVTNVGPAQEGMPERLVVVDAGTAAVLSVLGACPAPGPELLHALSLDGLAQLDSLSCNVLRRAMLCCAVLCFPGPCHPSHATMPCRRAVPWTVSHAIPICIGCCCHCCCCVVQ